MAFNILGLMHPLLFDVTQIEPIWADCACRPSRRCDTDGAVNGGMGQLTDLHILSAKIRTELQSTASTRKAISVDAARDFVVTKGAAAESLHKKVEITPRANFKLPFPTVKSYEAFSASKMAELRGGLLDLDKVVVLTGFAEVGPFGSARTRWEMEARGEFTLEGVLELAFVMGLIKHFDGRLKDGKAYVGWVDAKTGEPVDDKDARNQYEKHILEHTGVRLIGASGSRAVSGR